MDRSRFGHHAQQTVAAGKVIFYSSNVIAKTLSGLEEAIAGIDTDEVRRPPYQAERRW